MNIYPITPNLSWSWPEAGAKEAPPRTATMGSNAADNRAASPPAKEAPPELPPAPPPETSAREENNSLKAVIGYDEDKNPVVLFLDQEGQVVRQMPPQEYLDILSRLKQNVESLFEKIA